jgi:8-oxo-dGTP pyrophosphatase MutT (NUDIX family)
MPSPKDQVALSSLPYFDPRTVPVVGVDGHLPAVPAAQLLPAALRQRFVSPPLWTPEVTREIRFSNRQPAYAAVLIPVVMRERPTVLLTLRTAHMSTHSGQVAFPGGKSDDTDADAAATALREAYEEVGLAVSYAEVIGTLPIYTTGTAFIITPVVALVTPGFKVQANPDEVADVFEVPLDFVMNPSNHRRHVFEWESVRREWLSMPYQDRAEDGTVTERFIWGATAGILRNFYRFLSA